MSQEGPLRTLRLTVPPFYKVEKVLNLRTLRFKYKTRVTERKGEGKTLYRCHQSSPQC